MDELRKYALELAVHHLSKDAHNIDTVLHWADGFYKWLTQDADKVQTTSDPQTPYGKGFKEEVKSRIKKLMPPPSLPTPEYVAFHGGVLAAKRIIDNACCDKDMLSRERLKEKLQERHDAVKGAKWFKQDKHGSYLEAIEDVLRMIDGL